MRRLAFVAVLALLAFGASGCGSDKSASPAKTRQLTDLRDIDHLRSLFNTKSGEPRLILLVSPT